MTLRSIARSMGSSPPAGWLIAALERFDTGRSNVLAVLTYHRIGEPPKGKPASPLAVTPSLFEEHLDNLTRRYVPISMDELLDVRHGRARLPRHALLITFDDAYVDFETTAWPILRDRAVPAVLFVPTAYPDRPERWFWWDRLSDVLGTATTPSISTPIGDLPLATDEDRAGAHRLLRDHCKRVGVEAAVAVVEEIATQAGAAPPRNEVLGWDRLRELAAQGVAMAPHTQTHELLTRLPDERLAEELAGSREDMRRELGPASTTSLAYPSGDWDQRVVEATREAGFDLAFTTRRGVNDLRRGAWHSLRRVNVGRLTGSTLLRGQLGSWMALADRG